MDAAGVPLKTLYLLDVFDELADLGMLERVDDTGVDSKARYRIDEDSDVYRAAKRFDEAVAAER